MKPSINLNEKLKELERATSGHVEYIDALTGLRGLAACWVLLFHLWQAAKPRKIIVELFGEELNLTLLFSGGWIGVDIFLSYLVFCLPFLFSNSIFLDKRGLIFSIISSDVYIVYYQLTMFSLSC